MESLSFGPMAKLYDETRVFDKNCFYAALNFLTKRFPPFRYPKVFEPGIGTGRVAFPLAECGYTITGVDISGEMLEALRRQQAKRSGKPISCQMADVTALPFSRGVFDIVIAVHLFYFVFNWKTAVEEILRVCRTGGVVVLMHTGTGSEVPSLNDRYKALCQEAGCIIREMGVHSTREVVEYLNACGYEAEWIQGRWSWVAKLRLDRALDHLESRAYSFTTVAPDAVHHLAMKRLRMETESRTGSLNTEIEVPNQMYFVFIRKAGRSNSPTEMYNP